MCTWAQKAKIYQSKKPGDKCLNISPDGITKWRTGGRGEIKRESSKGVGTMNLVGSVIYKEDHRHSGIRWPEQMTNAVSVGKSWMPGLLASCLLLCFVSHRAHSDRKCFSCMLAEGWVKHRFKFLHLNECWKCLVLLFSCVPYCLPYFCSSFSTFVTSGFHPCSVHD